MPGGSSFASCGFRPRFVSSPPPTRLTHPSVFPATSRTSGSCFHRSGMILRHIRVVNRFRLLQPFDRAILDLRAREPKWTAHGGAAKILAGKPAHRAHRRPSQTPASSIRSAAPAGPGPRARRSGPTEPSRRALRSHPGRAGAPTSRFGIIASEAGPTAASVGSGPPRQTEVAIPHEAPLWYNGGPETVTAVVGDIRVKADGPAPTRRGWRSSAREPDTARRCPRDPASDGQYLRPRKPGHAPGGNRAGPPRDEHRESPARSEGADAGGYGRLRG